MKVNDRILVAGLAALMLSTGLGACNHDELSKHETSSSTTKATLQLASGITTSVTRAFDSSWETNDKIGVFTVNAGTTTITRSGTYEDANIPYVFSGSSTAETSGSNYMGFTAADDIPGTDPVEKKEIFLPIDGSNVDVYAYYPYDNTMVGTAKTVTLEAEQTLAGQKGCDLMSAVALSSTSPINLDNTAAQLLFRHELSKVLIKIKVGTGYSESDLANVALELQDQATSATYNPLTRTLEVGEASGTITPYQLVSGDADYGKKGDSYYIYRALVMPTTSASGSIVITVGTTTTATFSYNFPQALPAGYETIFTLTLQATGMTVTGAITPWAESSSVPEAPLNEQ